MSKDHWKCIKSEKMYLHTIRDNVIGRRFKCLDKETVCRKYRVLGIRPFRTEAEQTESYADFCRIHGYKDIHFEVAEIYTRLKIPMRGSSIAL